MFLLRCDMCCQERPTLFEVTTEERLTEHERLRVFAVGRQLYGHLCEICIPRHLAAMDWFSTAKVTIQVQSSAGDTRTTLHMFYHEGAPDA